MRAHDEHGNREFRKAPRAADREVRRPTVRRRRASRASARNGRRWRGSARRAGVPRSPAALEQLQRRIEALDRRAGRLGVAPIRLLDTGERDADGHAFVVLHGRAPVLAGWTLAAIVEHRDGHATVRPVERARRAARSGRVRDRDGASTAGCAADAPGRTSSCTPTAASVRQVGSGCLRDFVGGHDPERACRQRRVPGARASRAQARQHTRTRRSRPTDRSEPTLEEFAAHAAHVVRAHGFTSREQAQRASQTGERRPGAALAGGDARGAGPRRPGARRRRRCAGRARCWRQGPSCRSSSETRSRPYPTTGC